MEKQTTKCSHCKSENVIKWCKRKTQNRGLIQRYKCKDCNNTFTLDDGFFRMRNHPQKITCGLDLFYNGISTRKVQQHFKAFFPHNASNVSVYNWVVKYAKVMHKFTDKLKLKIGNEVQVDEVEYHRRESHRKGIKGVQTNFFVDSVDTKTRFMTGSEYCKSRTTEELKFVIKKVKQKTDNQIKVCTTDGFNAYLSAVKSVFGYYNLKKGLVKHNQVTQLRGEGFNHPIERLHNSLRQRTKTFRGFHGSIDSANAILKGFEVYYNFIRVHQAINCCPYELATDLKLSDNNKWLELIKLAKTKAL